MASGSTIDRSTSSTIRSAVSARSNPSTCSTASAARRSNPPENTDNKAKPSRLRGRNRSSDHSTAARNVWCRGQARRPPRNPSSRSLNDASKPSAPSARTRAAASSTANGNPSKR
jgi:hypothetical protein